MQRNTLWTEKSSTNFLFVVVQYLISRFRKIRALQTCKEYLGLKINPNFFHLKLCYLISRGRKICAYFCNLLLCNTWFQDSERFCALQICKEYLGLKINPRIFLIVYFAIWLQDSEHSCKEILKLKIKPKNNSFVVPYLISRLRRSTPGSLWSGADSAREGLPGRIRPSQPILQYRLYCSWN